ncbi:MAG: crossover junction endodeoxyribonuclease RuvC [Candidatus Roizmanbacteria bacterium]|nr:MAG: crossover junction endodeoxyribonuclease RuvC [Candidatus Roizmanbacteria bacterium]
MIVLAIDPGIEKVGYSYFEKKTNGLATFKYISSGVVKTSKKEFIQDRIFSVYNELKTLTNKIKPDLIVFEQLFFFKNAKTIVKVCQAQGVILLLASQEKIQVKTLTPLQIKQIITGYGNADKKSVQKMLPLLLKEKIEFKEDDQSDAVACGLAYCYLNEKLI